MLQPTPIEEQSIDFGMRPHVGGVVEVIESHCRAVESLTGETDAAPQPPPRDSALRVGILGPPGCGKTFWLDAIARHFSARLDQAAATLCNPATSTDRARASKPVGSLTLPVPFNAWRHAGAPTMVEALLKTAQHELLRHAERQFESRLSGLSVIFERKARKVALACGRRLRDVGAELNATGLTLAAGLAGFDRAPTSGSGESYSSRPPDAEAEEEEARRNAPVQKRECQYFDTREHLRSMLNPTASDELPLYILFLIDDLDRCHPRQSQQLLDAMHLLLNQRGLVFVVALDDERIERQRVGQRAGHGSLGVPSETQEYLEKVLPLPIRVPPVGEAQVRDFLLRRYRDIFVRGTPAPGFEPPLDTALLDFFVRATPAVPRRLAQTGEVFRAVDAVARRETSSDHDRRLLAQLVLLQLFAPELYRLDRGVHILLLLLAQWRDHSARSLEEISKAVVPSHPLSENEASWTDSWSRVREPLVAAVERYVASPAAFDPRRLILPDQQPSDFAPEIVAAHACLADGEEVRQSATLTAAMPGSEASEIGSETEEADRPSGEESEEEDD